MPIRMIDSHRQGKGDSGIVEKRDSCSLIVSLSRLPVFSLSRLPVLPLSPLQPVDQRRDVTCTETVVDVHDRDSGGATIQHREQSR